MDTIVLLQLLQLVLEKAKNNKNHKGDEEYNYFMAVCFQASQLTILDYNRVIKDLNGMEVAEFLKSFGEELYC